MKIANLLLILLLPICLGSCAPKVITHIERSYSPRAAAEEVHLYGVGQTVPESTELIGTVKVVDSGASTKCNYDQVVALAKQITSKNGGNALALTDHREPSFLFQANNSFRIPLMEVELYLAKYSNNRILLDSIMNNIDKKSKKMAS